MSLVVKIIITTHMTELKIYFELDSGKKIEMKLSDFPLKIRVRSKDDTELKRRILDIKPDKKKRNVIVNLT